VIEITLGGGCRRHVAGWFHLIGRAGHAALADASESLAAFFEQAAMWQ